MKKLLASLMSFCILGLNILPVLADECVKNVGCPIAGQRQCVQEQILSKEHLNMCPKSCVNAVTVTNFRKIICRDNVLAIVFECPFSTKTARTGDVVKFLIPNNVYTQEGTLVIPANTKIIAEVTCIQCPKWFNKNARVGLNFKCLVLPDCRVMPLCARPCTKGGVLMEGPWMTAGKIFLTTITFGIVGAGAGAGFGFIPTPTKIGVGLAAGIPTGLGLGLATALISKGLHYKAKCGEQVLIILSSDASIYN